MVSGILKEHRARYPLVGLTIGALKLLGALLLLISLAFGIWSFVEAEALASGVIPSTLDRYAVNDIRLAAAVVAIGGSVVAVLLGAFAQFMAMQRDRTLHAATQVQLLEDILELNEETNAAHHGTRVDMCDGCGKLGALHRIDSGEWMCRVCRRQLRSA